MRLTKAGVILQRQGKCLQLIVKVLWGLTALSAVFRHLQLLFTIARISSQINVELTLNYSIPGGTEAIITEALQLKSEK